jgi:outer membrane protein assembly factor BamD (BamD/ComL family)
MKKLYLIIFTIVIVSCNGPEKNMKDIRQLEANKSLATSDTLINSYVRFADKYPEHDSSVRYLFSAARVSVKANKVLQGTRLFERVATQYPNDTVYGPDALIIAGLNYSKIPDIANAKKMYDQFLRQYPKHRRYAEVAIMAEEVGMSEEQQMERFWKRFEATRIEDSIRNAQQQQ